MIISKLLFAQEEVNPNYDSCYYLMKIKIEGKRKTKDQFILRELNVKIGDCISDLNEIKKITEDRLLNLKLFNEVDVIWIYMEEDSIEMNIFILDRFPIFPEGNLEFADRNVNVWLNEQNMDLRRINLGLTLNHNNFRGNREVISISGQLGYTQKAGISYTRPFADKNQQHGFGFSAFVLQNKEIAYKTEQNKLLFYRDDDDFMLQRFDFAGWYIYRPDYAFTHILQLSYQHHWINSKILELNSTFLPESKKESDVFSLKYRLEYNGVDNWNYPLIGNRGIAEIEEKFSFNQSLQTSIKLQFDQYWNPKKHYYFSFIVRTKFSFPQNPAYVFQENLGYDYNYVRGYEYYVIDGSSFGLIRLNAKRTLIDYKLRLPIRYFEVIPIKVYGKVFADVGRGFKKNPALDDLLNNRNLYSSGFGIDIISLYDIKVRIEYTFNGLQEKGLFLHRNGE